MIEFKEEYHYKLRKFSSGPIQNEVLNISYEHPSSAYHFERKYQAKISPSDQSFENEEEELMEFKEYHNDELRSFHRDSLKVKCLLSPIDRNYQVITVISLG